MTTTTSENSFLRGKLCILITEQIISLGFGKNSCILCETIHRDGREDLSDAILGFLVRNGLSGGDITGILVGEDIPSAFPPLLEKGKTRLAYIKTGRGERIPEALSRLIEDTGNLLDIRYHEPPGDSGGDGVLSAYLEDFHRKGIQDILLAGPSEQEVTGQERILVSLTKRQYPDKFRVFHLRQREYTPFSCTENRLIAGGFLRGSLEDRIRSILRVFGDSKSEPPVFFLKGDGFFVESQEAVKDPLVLWQSGRSILLLDAALSLNLPDFIVATKHRGGLALDVIRNGTPVTGDRVRAFFGLQVDGEFPDSVLFNRMPRESLLEETIRTMNPCHGPVPVVNHSGEELPLLSPSFPVLRFPEDQGRILSALSASRYRKCLHWVQDNRSEAEITEGLLSELEQRGVKLQNPLCAFSVEPFRYMKRQAEILSLTLEGMIP